MDYRLGHTLGVVIDRRATVPNLPHPPGHRSPATTEDCRGIANPDIDRYTQHRSEPLVDKCIVPCDRFLKGSLSLSSPRCQPQFLAKEADLKQSRACYGGAVYQRPCARNR